MADRAGASAGLPLAAIACLGLILLGIAATIVLALIPIYIPEKSATLSATNAVSTTRSYSVPIDSEATSGSLSNDETSQLSDELTQQSGSSSDTDASATVSSGNVSGGRRKRQGGSQKALSIVIIFFGRNQIALNRIIRRFESYILGRPSDIGSFALGLIRRRTTLDPSLLSTTPEGVSASTSSSAVSTTAAGRRRRRQSNENGVTSAPLVTYRD